MDGGTTKRGFVRAKLLFCPDTLGRGATNAGRTLTRSLY